MTNNVVITGRVTRDIDVKQTRGGVTFAPFCVAVNERYANGTQETFFVDCVAWRNLAETIAKWTGKGKRLTVTGSLRTYTDKDDIKRTQVVVDEVDFIDFKEQSQEDREVDELLEEEDWVL